MPLLTTLLALGLPNPTADSKFDAKDLTLLEQQCKDTESDALVVMIDGKVVLNKWFKGQPGPIEAMSATKSVVNLAIGLLIKEGKIKGVDDKVQRFFPDYKGGGKENVTVRHLMDHTSGIEARADTGDIYPSPDFVKNAMEKPLSQPPGTRFFYNNRAINLLAGVASKAAGKRMDIYLKEKLFKPLGITDFGWSLDKSGNPHGMAGFQVRPEDMAKIGQFVLDGGKDLLPKGWMEDSTKPSVISIRQSSPCGWLWWPTLEKTGRGVNDYLMDLWKKAGIKPELVDKVKPIKDKPFKAREEYFAAFRECFKDDPEGMKEINSYFTSGKVNYIADLSSGPVHSYTAAGYLGQYMVIVPSAKLVVVRMRRARQETEEEQAKRSFPTFAVLVDSLTRE